MSNEGTRPFSEQFTDFEKLLDGFHPSFKGATGLALGAVESSPKFIYLYGTKWRGSIHVRSMRYFTTYEVLDQYLIETNQKTPCRMTFIWRVYSDGTEAQLLAPKELKALGIR